MDLFARFGSIMRRRSKDVRVSFFCLENDGEIYAHRHVPSSETKFLTARGRTGNLARPLEASNCNYAELIVRIVDQCPWISGSARTDFTVLHIAEHSSSRYY
jgi:hypothetical protein